MGKTFDWFSHPFILTLYPFNVLRKVFKRFVVRLREWSIHLSGISGKTLKPVSFHTGSREVLYKILSSFTDFNDFNRLTTGLHVYSSITYIDLNQQQIALRYNCTVNLIGNTVK